MKKAIYLSFVLQLLYAVFCRGDKFTPHAPTDKKTEKTLETFHEVEFGKSTRPKNRRILNLFPASGVQACLSKAPIDWKKFNPRETEILKALEGGKPPEFAQVTDAWLDGYLTDYNSDKKHKFTLPFVKGILNRATGESPKDLFELKKQLDKGLETLHETPVIYNEAFANPVELLLHGKGQCLSGSVCYSLAARNAWGEEDYHGKNPVMIFTNGHILPGFIIENKKEEKYLIGIESTVSGKGVRNFGKTADLAKGSLAVRVVDAESFALLEIFANRLDEKVSKCLRDLSQSETAKKHGIDLLALETKIETEKRAKAGTGDKSPRRNSGLGFGDPSVAPGDQKRAHLESEDGRTLLRPEEIVPENKSRPGRESLHMPRKSVTRDQLIRQRSEIARLVEGENGLDSANTSYFLRGLVVREKEMFERSQKLNAPTPQNLRKLAEDITFSRAFYEAKEAEPLHFSYGDFQIKISKPTKKKIIEHLEQAASVKPPLRDER